MSIHNRIEGVIRLTSPMHCASPDKRILPQKLQKSGTPTVHTRLVTSNGMQEIPYFPGNDIRGRLRRKAAKLVMDQITIDKKIGLKLYVGLNSSSISAKPDTSPLTVEEVLRAKENVYMGLFGGGARILKSRYKVSDLFPIIADTIEIGSVPERFGEDGFGTFLPKLSTADGMKPTAGYQLTEITQFIKIDDTYRVLRPHELELYVGNVNEVVQYQEEITAAAKERKEDKAKAEAGEIKEEEISGKFGLGNVLSIQSILAGTPMYFRLDFDDDASDSHIGLMLLSLQSLVREQALGGRSSIGYGKFTADLNLVRHGESMPIFTEKKASDAATLTSAVIEQFVNPASQALSILTEEEMLSFFKNRETKGDKDSA